MFMEYIVVMVSLVYTYFQTYQSVSIIYVQLFVCQLYNNKVALRKER